MNSYVLVGDEVVLIDPLQSVGTLPVEIGVMLSEIPTLWESQGTAITFECSIPTKRVSNLSTHTKAMIIILCVITLHLDRRMANVVTRLQVARDECQNFVVVDVRRDADMAREECFAHGDGPDVQLVHRDHAGQLLEASLHLPSIHLPRRALHEDREDVAQHLDGGEQHEHREQERADEVDHFPLGVIPDRRSTHHHADALDEVAEHVEVCAFDVDVARAPLVRRGRLGARARVVRTLGLTFVGSIFHMLMFVCTRLVHLVRLFRQMGRKWLVFLIGFGWYVVR